MRYHSLIAEADSMPDQLQVTAQDERNRLIMALQHKTDRLYGVQFQS